MPDAYKIHVSAKAEQQLTEIGKYIAIELASPITAEHLLGYLQSQISSLSVFPGRFPYDDDEIPRKMGVHKMVCRSYLVYFIIDEDAKSVDILSVLYGRRNQLEILLDDLS